MLVQGADASRGLEREETTMRFKALIAAGTTTLILTSAASAAFTTLSAVGTETTLSDGSPILVVQVFANFSDPTDRLLSITAASLSASQALYQNAFGTGTEPVGALLPIFPDLAFDSYVTMNKESTLEAGPPTSLEPGSAFSATGFTGGWFTDGDAPQTTGQLSYLIAQLSIEDYNRTVNIFGTLTVAWKTALGSAQFSEATVIFPPPPAPGALPLLGIAALAGSRRRR
jgi:MYXO-CTERM domain-containing protein